jgi:hypothetical protein
LDIYDKLHEE